jgi:hypothetical protein
MSIVKPLLIPVIAAVLVLILAAAGYVVVPACDPGDHGWGCGSETAMAKGWIAQVTNIGTTESGDLRIELAILNETGDWSSMQAVPAAPAVLTVQNGQPTDCDTVLARVATISRRVFRCADTLLGRKRNPRRN